MTARQMSYAFFYYFCRKDLLINWKIEKIHKIKLGTEECSHNDFRNKNIL